jgi:hypothetical protein
VQQPPIYQLEEYLFSKKTRFLVKAVCLAHLKSNWFNYLLLIGAIALNDQAMALTRLESLILRTLSEATEMMKFLRDRNRKKLNKSKTKRAQ